MLTIHPGNFIETGGCSGPRYIRGQPSRESPGVIMTEIQDKYIPEFELPYRNVERYIHEIKNNWNRLNPEQRDMIKKSFKSMDFEFKEREEFTQITSVIDVGKFAMQDPIKNTKEILNLLWNPSVGQKQELIKDLNSAEAENNLKNLRAGIYDWTTEQSYTLYTNWKSGILLFFFILLFLFIGIAIGNNKR